MRESAPYSLWKLRSGLNLRAETVKTVSLETELVEWKQLSGVWLHVSVVDLLHVKHAHPSAAAVSKYQDVYKIREQTSEMNFRNKGTRRFFFFKYIFYSS